MTAEELRTTADQIILKCSAYTGAELPATDFFATTLSETIISFLLNMGYSDLNENEIIFSMEMNLNHSYRLPGGMQLVQAEFSGRCVNLTFIANVLSNYMAVRTHIERRFQNLIDGYE
jgi:hypothetical protein